MHAVFLPADLTLKDFDVGVLDHDERRRMQAYRRFDDALTYAHAHVALRQLVSERVAIAPAELRFSRDTCPACGEPHGRPIVDRCLHETIEFSLSRGPRCYAVTVAEKAVGIDIELEPRSRATTELTGLLHLAERREILAGGEAQRSRRFTRIWTRKEAYLKGLGVGLSRGLAIDDLTKEPPGWTIADRPLPQRCHVAVAVAL